MIFDDKQLKHITKAVMPSIEMAQKILIDWKEVMRPYEEMQQQLQKLIVPYQEAMARLAEPMEEVLRATAQTRDWIKRIKEQKEIEKRVFLESGWWLSPTMLELPASVIDDAVRKYEQGDRGAISRMLGAILCENKCQNLKSMVESWQSNKYFRKWKLPIGQALNAHVRGDYSVSIPALLLISEGIAKDYCVKKKIYSKKIRNKGGKKLLRALEDSGIINEDTSSSYLINAIQECIYKDTDGLVAKQGFAHRLNRHAVLHGLTATYGTRKNSLQCFMLLDSLTVLK